MWSIFCALIFTLGGAYILNRLLYGSKPLLHGKEKPRPLIIMYRGGAVEAGGDFHVPGLHAVHQMDDVGGDTVFASDSGVELV